MVRLSQGNSGPTPRILIGTPTFGYHEHCIDEFVAALELQSERCFDYVLVDNSPTLAYVNELRAKGLPVIRAPYHHRMRERTTVARNLIREIVLRGAYSHLLFLDQDVMLPPHGLARLLQHSLPVVSGIYCKDEDGERYAMVVLPDWQTRPGGIKVTPLILLEGRGLVEIEAAGFGCLLIERRLVEKLPFRYDLAVNMGTDLTFCADVRSLGCPIYCDSQLRCEHRYIVRDFWRHPEWGEW